MIPRDRNLPTKDLLFYLDATISDEEVNAHVNGPAILRSPHGTAVKIQCSREIARRLLNCGVVLRVDRDDWMKSLDEIEG